MNKIIISILMVVFLSTFFIVDLANAEDDPILEILISFFLKISTLKIVPAESKQESAEEIITDKKLAKIIPEINGDKFITAIGIARYGFERFGYSIIADNAIIAIAIAKTSLKSPEKIAPFFAVFSSFEESNFE